MTLALTLAATAGLATALRWLRVAQREHYLAPAVSRFARRWWMVTPTNRVLGLLGLLGVVGVWWRAELGWLALATAIGPIGLLWRGSTSRLTWTPRLRRLGYWSIGLAVIGSVVSFLTEEPGWALIALGGLPVLIDLALLITAPIEKRIGEKWVAKAAAKMAASGARVVAITGSYGKTTTKGYVAHLLSGRMKVVVSPASFNNRMGLARAINEQLTPGTHVFVAEMGTYGRGEIAELCEFVPPEVALITALGPVHLERFKTEAEIAEAKREIVVKATMAAINVDHPLLAIVAEEEASQRKVVRCSALDSSADVAVIDGRVVIGGETIGQVGAEVMASNLACAVAVARYFDIAISEIAGRLSTLPNPDHRREISKSDQGFLIVDDTYNSNPAGARVSLALLTSIGKGRRVVVTPGMVELGSIQHEENRKLGAEIAATATDLVVVGRTNRQALVEGAEGGSAAVSVVRSRADAVDWVRSQLGPGDAVLYENDLPDHYP